MTETLAVTVKPRATQAGVTLAEDGSLIVRVHAPAAEGQANKECIEAVAAAVGVPKSAVTIARGAKSRSKQLAIAGLTAAQARERLAQTGKKAKS